MNRQSRRPRAVVLAILLGVAAPLCAGEPPSPMTEALSKLKLPGIEIKAEDGYVDVAAEICLDNGLLELIACTKGTKEHESIIAIEAKPIHVHTALLLIGARNGNPAMRKPINEEQTRWMDLPPSGNPIHVFLVFKNEEGKTVERPIGDFVTRAAEDPYYTAPGAAPASTEEENKEKKEKFPSVFLFTGSHLVEHEDGGRQYLADESGHVITISTFGDELLGLPDFQSRENGELIWEIDPTHLPKTGSKVTLRLRPEVKPATE